MPLKDKRDTADGLPLRKTRPLEFLDGLAQQPNKQVAGTWCLYEGQISVLLTGIDDWRYEAMVFADAFFDGSLSTKRNHDATTEHVRLDPLTKGECIVKTAQNSQSPRLYFLEVCRVWVDHIEKEWRFIVDEITETVET